MKTLLSIIVIFSAVFFSYMYVTTNFQAFGEGWVPVENKNTTMKILIQSSPTSMNLAPPQDRQIHLMFFDTNTGNLIQNVTFSMKITKANQTLLYNDFWTKSGSFTLNLKPGERYLWSANPDHDPMDGLYYSKGDQIDIDTSYLTEDLYNFEFQPIVYVVGNNVHFMALPDTSQQNDGIKFETTLNLLDTYNKTISPDSSLSNSIIIESPLKQFKSGIAAKDVKCRNDLQLVIKAEDGSPACVNSAHVVKLVALGWAESQENNGVVVTLGEGQREGPLLVQKIFPDSIQGLNFREYPLATNVGYPITLHIGDSASNGCTVELTLIKIGTNTATFLKKEYQNRPCPICLSENTAIDTPNGPINVKELKIGMTVFTQDSSGHKQAAMILKTGRTLATPDHMMVHVVLADKRELYVSPNHPTSDGRLFGELLVGDTLDGSKIKSAERVPYNGTYTYDILPSGQTGFYWANGILVASTLK